MTEDDPIQAGRDRRAALAAQRAAEAPSPEEAKAAQRRASRSPTSAEARDAQRRAGNYVNSRDRLMDQGQSRYNAAVNENATSMREPPGGRRTGYGSPSMVEPPEGRKLSPAARAASQAASAGAGAIVRGAARRLPIVGDLISGSTPVADATLNTPEARRLLAEDAARRAGPGRADADMENPMPRPRMGAELRADADMENPMPRPYVGAEIDRVVQGNKPRPNTRSTNRMSPRGMSANDLNEISLATAQRRGGAEMESGRSGDIARRIMAREGEQDRQREMENMKRGGPVKKMASGGVVKSSASGRSDGCAVKGKTKGRMV